MEAPLLAADERRRVLSTFRLKLILSSFVLVLLVGLSAMMFVLVTRIFDSLTPAVRADLGWKAERGAAELARATELGILVADEKAIRGALGAYLSDPDVTSIVVAGRDGKRLVTDGPFAETREQLGGYFLIEAKDLNEAIGVAARIPGARKGTIEVRPVMELTGLPESRRSTLAVTH